MSDALKQALDLSVFWEYRDVLLRGLAVNFYVFAAAAVVALGIGLLAALLRVSRLPPMRWIGTLHVEIFRNAPEYIMVVWVHFVLPLLLSLLLAKRLEFNPFLSSVIALGFVYSGYFAETFRAGIEAIPKAHIEAGRACGMSERLILWRIVLPQVVRRMLPESLNQFISLFKATTIVSLIAVPDLMYQVTMVTQQEMQPLPLYTGAALVYFAVIFVAGTVLREGGRAIDVCGGLGHLTRSLLDLSSPAPVLADLSFAKLWLARRFTAPGCEPVCCDGNAPLPFAKDAFGLVVCSDAFHYIWTKRLLAAETMRVAAGRGAVVVTHAHNAHVWSPSAGMPLPPEAYRELFDEMAPRLFAESVLLNEIVAGGVAIGAGEQCHCRASRLRELWRA